MKYELDVGWIIRGSGYADELPGCHHVPGGPRASHEPQTCPCYEGRTANLNRHMPICIYPFYDGRTHSKWPLLRRTRGEAGRRRTSAPMVHQGMPRLMIFAANDSRGLALSDPRPYIARNRRGSKRAHYTVTDCPALFMVCGAAHCRLF